MTVRGQWTVVGIIVVVVAAAVLIGAHFFGDEFVQITVGSRAPDFHAVTLDAPPKPRTVGDYTGQVTLVNVWATWCLPCEKEMPTLEALYQRYHDKGFHLVAVSVDAPGMANDVRKYAERHKLTFDVFWDSTGKIARDYMTTGYPESFIIGRDGVIRYKEIGAPPLGWDRAEIHGLLDQLLAEPAK